MKAVTDVPLRLILTEPAFVALPLLTIISLTTKRIPAGTVGGLESAKSPAPLRGAGPLVKGPAV